jgi:hypothetical protein
MIAMTTDENYSTKICSVCGSKTTFMEQTEWGIYPHWYGTIENPVCKKCYVRNRWQEKYVPKDVKCTRCGNTTTAVSRYGTPMWVKDRVKEGVYYCKACFVIIRDTGKERPKLARENVGRGIHSALENGRIFGKKKYSLLDFIFDTITEESAYWMGMLMADGWIFKEKTGAPRIAITLAEKDYAHLVKFSRFLKSTYPILRKTVKRHGKIVYQYSIRVSSMRIAEKLIGYGIVPRKSLIAKVIGLENNEHFKHFWRGVMDGDGYLKNRDGKDGDRIVLTGSNDLLKQFEDFIRKNIPNSEVTLKKVGSYSKLYVYSDTARALSKLLYYDCRIALKRKLAKARKMYYMD